MDGKTAGNEILYDSSEKNQEEDFEKYIHSEEFISKFGDWEKANRLEKLNEKNKLNAFNPQKRQDNNELQENKSPSAYYDKRLINICQVPQMPYLEMKNGKWQPKEEAVQAVKEGKLFIEKDGQNYTMHDESAASFEISALDENGNTHYQTEEEKELPALKIHSELKEEKIQNLQIVTQEEFNRIVDSLYQPGKPDYRNIPEIIRLPKMNGGLAKKLGIKNENFFLKTNAAHVRPQRKGGYNQSFRKEEMKGMLDFIAGCQTAYIDSDERHQNFFLAGLDEQDNKKSNKIVFNKDKLGNYIVTIGKVESADLNSKNYTKVAVGVEPTIEKPEIKKDNVSYHDFAAGKIVYGKTVLPPFASMTSGGHLKTCENFVVKGYDSENGTYFAENGSEKLAIPRGTFNSLLNPASLHKSRQEEKIFRMEGNGIVFDNPKKGVKGTVVPEFSLMTQNGLQTYKDCVVSKFNESDKTYTFRNSDSIISVTEEQFKEITSPERFSNKFDENTPAYKKLLKTQYEDFFKERANTAYNFRHNLSVFCRKEANSPCDALKVAKGIIQKMSRAEQVRTKKLLQKIAREGESLNQLQLSVILRTELKLYSGVSLAPLGPGYPWLRCRSIPALRSGTASPPLLSLTHFMNMNHSNS